jgi:16S rRNA (guanine1207-N2)-methyltransferase
MSRLLKTEGRAQSRDSASAEVLLGAIELPADAAVLVAFDADRAVENALTALGHAVTPWWRLADLGHSATPWPEPGPFDVATLRLTKDKTAFEMALHAVAAVVRPGGTIFVYGANDEGIKSVPRRMAALFGDVDVIDARRHCRVIAAARPDEMPDLRVGLDAWAREVVLDLPKEPVTHIAYPGVFAKGRLDAATAVLLDVLPTPAPHAGVLDFGCGAGVIAGALLRREPTLKLQLLDADAVAAAAARKNVPGALVRVGASWGSLPAYQRYDLIVSNPPIHRGKERDYSVVMRLIEGAQTRITEAGSLWMVLQRQVPVEDDLWMRFDEVEKVVDDRHFRVWRACRPARKVKTR